MRLHLATTPNADVCTGVDCWMNRDFDQRVQQLGERLSAAAFKKYPELSARTGHFEFVVAEKEEFGSASNATGKIVVFRGIQKLYLDDEGLAFLLAREMGHVIGHHHDENSVPTIAFTVLTTVLFPVAGVFKGASFLAGTTSTATAAVTTTSAVTAAASSATSYVGSHAILASLRPDQLSEADVIALGLLEDIGCNNYKVAVALESCTQAEGDATWVEDFHLSTAHVKKLAEASGIDSATLVADRANPEVMQDVPVQASETKNIPLDANVEPAANIVPAEGLPAGLADQTVVPAPAATDVVQPPVAQPSPSVDADHMLVAGSSSSVLAQTEVVEPEFKSGIKSEMKQAAPEHAHDTADRAVVPPSAELPLPLAASAAHARPVPKTEKTAKMVGSRSGKVALHRKAAPARSAALEYGKSAHLHKTDTRARVGTRPVLGKTGGKHNTNALKSDIAKHSRAVAKSPKTALIKAKGVKEKSKPEH